MAKFKVIVSDPLSGASKVIELEGARAGSLLGKKIGDTIDGAIVDLPAHKIQVTSGSDKDGTPMRPNVHGGVRRAVVLSDGPGFKPTRKGQRKRKVVRGDVITDEIVQINMKIVERPDGAAPLAKPAAKQEAAAEA